MNINPILTIISKEGNTYVINAHYLNPGFDIKYWVYIYQYDTRYFREDIKITNMFSYNGTVVPTACNTSVELEEFKYENGYQYKGEDWDIIQSLKNLIKMDKLCQ